MHDCISCGKVFELAKKDCRYCSDACRDACKSQLQDYNADSIKIKSDDESMPDWELIPYLASEYCRDKKWVERSIQACRESGTSIDYFIARYLKRDMSMRLNQDVNAAAIKLMRVRND